MTLEKPLFLNRGGVKIVKQYYKNNNMKVRISTKQFFYCISYLNQTQHN